MNQSLSLLPNFSMILVSGNNAQTFLQGQVTSDVRLLHQHGDYSFSACCDHKGRMLANFWIIKWHEHYGLILPESMKTIVSAHLQKYAPFSKVTIDSEFNGIHLISAEQYSTQQLQKIFDPNSAIITLPNPQRHIILCTTLPNAIAAYDNHLWRLNNIIDKLCILYPETSLLFTPQMIGLEKQGGVSFEKGCYVGQEIVARTQHLGKLKRHCHHVQFEANECPKRGDDYLNSAHEVIGTVVDAVMRTPNRIDALAVIQDQDAMSVKPCACKPIN